MQTQKQTQKISMESPQRISTESPQHLKQESANAVKQFVSDMTFIIEAIYQKNKKDPQIIELKDKFCIIRREDPTAIIAKAGPYLWKYREQIKQQNITFFLNNEFETDIVAATPAEVLEATTFEDVPILLEKCKNTWHMFQITEQETLIKKIRGLLRSYALYISVQKQIE